MSIKLWDIIRDPRIKDKTDDLIEKIKQTLEKKEDFLFKELKKK